LLATFLSNRRARSLLPRDLPLAIPPLQNEEFLNARGRTPVLGIDSEIWYLDMLTQRITQRIT